MRPIAKAKEVDIDYSLIAVDLSHLIDHLFLRTKTPLQTIMIVSLF